MIMFWIFYKFIFWIIFELFLIILICFYVIPSMPKLSDRFGVRRESLRLGDSRGYREKPAEMLLLQLHAPRYCFSIQRYHRFQPSANLLKGFRRSSVGRTNGSRWFEGLEGCGRQAGPVAKQEFLLNGSLGNKATTLTADLIRSGSHYSVLRVKEKPRCYLGI